MPRKFSLIAGLCALCLGSACGGRPRALGLPDGANESGQKALPTGVPRIASLDLTRGLPEAAGSGGLLPASVEATYFGLVRKLEELRRDGEVRGVLVELGESPMDFAHAEELGALLKALRVPVTCHAHSLGNQSAWLVAKGCDSIWMSPAGSLETIGLAGQSVYLGDLLTKVGVQADFVSAGKFKSFAETFTRNGPTDEARESLLVTLRSIREAWLGESARERTRAKNLAEDFESGPFTPGEAVARGLVDQIGYAPEALSALKLQTKTTAVEARFGPHVKGVGGQPLVRLLRSLMNQPAELDSTPRVALVPTVGSISMAGGGTFESQGITANAMHKTLQRLKDNDAVKAVVLRIDSPGGSALASDLIWKDVMALRQRKPVVASIGAMAASGGYYIASGCNRIIAPRSSIVGSIGVVGGKFSVNQALEQFGVHALTFPASPRPDAEARAAYLSLLTPWNDVMKERVRAQILTVYDLFLKRVSEGRKKPVELIAMSAEGRIWSGVQGLERGLVDEFGGLEDSIVAARRLAGLPEGAPVSFEGLSESWLDLLFHGDAPDADEAEARLRGFIARQSSLAEAVPEELRPYLNAVNAMARGDQVLALSPYVLTLK
ncbi:MAG: S49 family peptidase [Polyangiaceae bacterium]|nr:S49 family peptidase [Polyangiaceae bacterium]